MKKFLILSVILLSLTSCNNTTGSQALLDESEIINLMEEKMYINQDWSITNHGEIITFSYVPEDTMAEGISFSVNTKTGTVYEYISGAPQTNLIIKDSPDFSSIYNGDIYYAEIYKIANPFLESNNLLPTSEDWIIGGYGDGYLLGEVKQGENVFFIKFDIFTKEWEEIENPFN